MGAPSPTSPPNPLFKYVTPARIDVLADRFIRFTQPAALNDPFEMRPHYDSVVPTAELDSRLRPPMAMIEESLKEQYARLPEAKRRLLSFEQMKSFFRDRPEVINSELARIQPVMRM